MQEGRFPRHAGQVGVSTCLLWAPLGSCPSTLGAWEAVHPQPHDLPPPPCSAHASFPCKQAGVPGAGQCLLRGGGQGGLAEPPAPSGEPEPPAQGLSAPSATCCPAATRCPCVPAGAPPATCCPAAVRCLCVPAGAAGGAGAEAGACRVAGLLLLAGKGAWDAARKQGHLPAPRGTGPAAARTRKMLYGRKGHEEKKENPF